MKCMQFFIPLLILSNLYVSLFAQNAGIGTPNPQSTLHVRGNQLIDGANSYMTCDSVSGKLQLSTNKMADNHLLSLNGTRPGGHDGNRKYFPSTYNEFWWLDNNTPDAEVRGTVLHEFGHALDLFTDTRRHL